MLGVEALIVHVHLLASHLAAEVVLRKRRALVGPLLLRADEHDAPIEPLLAKRLGGLGAGEARADDHVRSVTAHAGFAPRARQFLPTARDLER
jgi:hypothetical protein